MCCAPVMLRYVRIEHRLHESDSLFLLPHQQLQQHRRVFAMIMAFARSIVSRGIAPLA